MFDPTLTDVAKRLVAHCQAETEAQGLDELYAPDAVSMEACAMSGGPREFAGLEAIKGKHAWWAEAMEVHSASAEGPFLYEPDRFGVIFEADVTDRKTGERTQMKELGVYTVADGKIVREEFFYAA